MPYCAPLRILHNGANLIRTATLTPSSVKPAENTVLPIPAARSGTASVALSGSYTGSEDATLDIEIVDVLADVKRASAPVLVGQGTGSLTDISVTGFAAQDVTVELKDAGIPITSAAIDFEGVRLVAADPGNDGNNIHIHIDAGIGDSPPGLVFAATNFSLLEDLAAGKGGATSGLAGPGWDWDTAAIGADNVIPESAHRIAFGDDTSIVYLAYKQFADNAWSYHFVPAILRDVAGGTLVKFVTGGRTVEIIDSTSSPATTETYTDIETVYDLLHQIKENSALVTVSGVVALDRTPTGQDARDLLVRTDAHVEPSYGHGSSYATGFASAYAEADAGTELVTARCYAVNGSDHPLAHIGAERWQVSGSLSGLLADAVTDVPYVAEKWGFVIPVKLPIGFGAPKGSISANVAYASRESEETEPPICPVALTLGSAASDQSVTFVYRRRPTGDCGCADMAIPKLRESCLGLLPAGGDTMTYTADALERLRALYDWATTLATSVTQYIVGSAADGIPETTENSSSDISPASRQAVDGTIISYGNVHLTDAVFPVDSTLVATTFSDFGLPANFQSLVDDFEATIQLIDELEAGTPKDDGWTQWDAALTAASTDLTDARYHDVATEKYKIMLRKALAYAGISPMGKSDASILDSGDGCWRDSGDAYWWLPESGGYAPAFSNVPYYSSRRSGEDGKYFSTHEFGFQLNIKCPSDLRVGDAVTIIMGNAAWPSTYQVGDELVLPIIAAHDLYLAGGQDGNTVQTWNVRGSVAGALPNYVLDTAAPGAYLESGLGFQINQGGIAFALGDRWMFACEGGHFQWRVNGGAWNGDSPALDIPDGVILLYQGLSATFPAGAAPSFATGDVYSFRILQPRAASNVQTPGPEAWQWVGDGQSMSVDLGSVQTIDNLAVALHTLPDGCTITVEGAGTLGSPFDADWSETLTWHEGPIYQELATPQSARYLRWTFAGVSAATVGYLFAGAPVKTSLSADLSLSRAYKILRGSGGLYQGGRYLGKAVSGEIEWTEGALPESDVAVLQAMCDWIKGHDDEPVIIVPNVTRPHEAFMGQAAVDEIEWPDVFTYGPNAGKGRRHSTRIPIAGVWS